MELVAGSGCLSASGYNGWRISLEEMKGCRAVQALVPKDQVENWKPEDDDQDFERESEYFLSGIGDGSPDEAPLGNMKAVRHGLESVMIFNTIDGDVGALIPIFSLQEARSIMLVAAFRIGTWYSLLSSHIKFREFVELTKFCALLGLRTPLSSHLL